MSNADFTKRPARDADWSDTHSGPVRSEFTTARQALEYGFENTPPWFGHAMKARNSVVGMFGLQTEASDGSGLMANLPVLHETPELYEIGIPDKHLTFTIIAALSRETLNLTTMIWFNNWTGRVYLAGVLVPHKLVIKQILKGLK